jgi:hypothetical protein
MPSRALMRSVWRVRSPVLPLSWKRKICARVVDELAQLLEASMIEGTSAARRPHTARTPPGLFTLER